MMIRFPRYLLVIAWCLFLKNAHGGELSDYHNQQAAQGGAAGFTDLERREDIPLSAEKRIRLILVVGDLFDFVGPRDGGSSPSKKVWPVEAMIVSTNTGLNFEMDNPTVQRELRKRLPVRIGNPIREEFAKRGPLKDFNEAVVVPTSKNFSPANFAFVATDKPNGGTALDPFWQTEELKLERIGVRISNSLSGVQPLRAKTMVTGLIGASKVELDSINKPGKYIPDGLKRLEMRKRMCKSVSGILNGVGQYLSSPASSSAEIDEFAIVIWTDDVMQFVDPIHLKDGSYNQKKHPGGYTELRDHLLRAFDEGVKVIRDRRSQR